MFRDIAGNGIVAGSFSPAAHETHLPYDPADRREVCTGLTISNNYINDVTNEDWGTLGICAGYVSDINIEHNEISYRHALLLLCALIIALLAALTGSYDHLEKNAQEPASSASDSIQPNDNKVIDYQLWDK